MSSPRVLIVVLLLIAVLFVISINLGTLHTDDQTFQQPPWVTGMGNVFNKPQPLQVSDLRPQPASCLQQGKLLIAPGPGCTFAIAQAAFSLRHAGLQLLRGASVQVTLTQEGILPIEQTLSSGTPTTNADFKIYPGKASGVLRIQCLDAQGTPGCLVSMQ